MKYMIMIYDNAQSREQFTGPDGQELMGEMLLDVPGALWTRKMMDDARVEHGPPAFRRIVVAIDPAGSSNKNSDETGIVVAGIVANGDRDRL